MNKSQKISILVCVFSGVVFLTSVYLYARDGAFHFDSRFIFGYNKNINYVGMISLGLFVSSLVGYFILSDNPSETWKKVEEVGKKKDI